MTEPVSTTPKDDAPLAYERAYFERGFIAAIAWSLTKREGAELSDDVFDHAWAHREGMDEGDILPVAALATTPPATVEAQREAVIEAVATFLEAEQEWLDRQNYIMTTRNCVATIRKNKAAILATTPQSAPDEDEVERVTSAIVADLRRQSQVQRGVSFDYEPLAGVADMSMGVVVHEVSRAAIAAIRGCKPDDFANYDAWDRKIER